MKSIFPVFYNYNIFNLHYFVIEGEKESIMVENQNSGNERKNKNDVSSVENNRTAQKNAWYLFKKRIQEI